MGDVLSSGTHLCLQGSQQERGSVWELMRRNKHLAFPPSLCNGRRRRGKATVTGCSHCQHLPNTNTCFHPYLSVEEVINFTYQYSFASYKNNCSSKLSSQMGSLYSWPFWWMLCVPSMWLPMWQGSPGAGTASPVVLPAASGNRGVTAVPLVSLHCSILSISAVNTL